jgi:hypothetical protein
MIACHHVISLLPPWKAWFREIVKADMLRYGATVPIVIYRGRAIFGRDIMQIAHELGMPFDKLPKRYFHGTECEAYKEALRLSLMWGDQLTESQRAAICVTIASAIEAADTSSSKDLHRRKKQGSRRAVGISS